MNAIREEPNPLRRLGELWKVSTAWWGIIRSTPSLWTFVRADCPGVEIALERSKGLPLDVVLEDWRRYSETGLPALPKIPRKKVDLILAQKRRWRSIVLSSSKRRLFEEVFAGPLPLLEDVHMEFPRREDIVASDFRGWTGLRRLYLRNVLVERLDGLKLERLERLELHRMFVKEGWAGELINALVASSRLERLWLSEIRRIWPWSESEPTYTPAFAPITTLKSLHLEEMDPSMTATILRGIQGGPHLGVFRHIFINGADPTIILNAMSSGTPSLLRSVINDTPLDKIYVRIDDGLIAITDDETPNVASSKLIVSLETLHWPSTLVKLAEVLETSTLTCTIHLRIGRTGEVEVKHTGAAFLDHFQTTLSHIQIDSTHDARTILEHIKEPSNVPKLKSITFWTHEDLVELLKEVLWSRPKLKVTDLDLDGEVFRWGLRWFLGREISCDSWIDGYVAPEVVRRETLALGDEEGGTEWPGLEVPDW